MRYAVEVYEEPHGGELVVTVRLHDHAAAQTVAVELHERHPHALVRLLRDGRLCQTWHGEE